MNTEDGEDIAAFESDEERRCREYSHENLLARLNRIERQMENFICLMDANKVQLNLIESLVQRLLNRRRV